MSYVSGTGLISGSGGSSTQTNVQITIDHEAVIKNKDDIASLTSVVNNLTTNDIPEGTDETLNNLYYTEDRVDANIALKTTDDIGEGDTNLYYTEDRVNSNTELLTIKNQINGYTDSEGNDIYGILQVIYGYPIGGDKTSEGYTNGILDYITNLQKSVDGYVDSEGNVVLGILQVIHGHPMGDSENEDYVKGILDILQDLENKDKSQDQTAIASMVAQGAYELGKWATGKAKNGGAFGKKLTNSYSPLTNSASYNTITGDTIEELLGELNNFVDVYRYNAINSEAGINHDPITGYKLMVGGKTRIKGDLEFLKKGSTTIYYSLQDLIFIKSLDVNTLSIDSNNKLSVKIKPDSGISSDTNGLYVNYEGASLEIDSSTKKLKVKDDVGIQDGKNGIERLLSPEADKNKLQLKLKTNNSGLIANNDGLHINPHTNTLEIDSTTNKLKVKIKTDSGISSGTEGIYQKYLISSIDDTTLSKTNNILKVKDGKFHPLIKSIENKTSTSQGQSTLSFKAGTAIEKDTLVFTEGTGAKTNRDQAQTFRNQAKGYAVGNSEGITDNGGIATGAKQYSETAQTYRNQAKGYALGNSGGADNGGIATGAKQYADEASTHKNEASTHKNDAKAYANGGMASTGSQVGAREYARQAGASAGAAAGSASTAGLMAGIATGSAGFSAIVAIGSAIANGDGSVSIAAVPIKTPLQIQEEAIGLNINKNELNVDENKGYLELNDAYASIIDWKSKNLGSTELKINIEGISGIGVKDVISSHPIQDADKFVSRLVDILPDSNKSVIAFDGSRPIVTDSHFKDRFQYDSTSKFTDHTKLTLSFWSKITETQLNRNQYYSIGDEVIFHTNSETGQSSGSGNNGINIKFVTGRTGPIRIQLYIRFRTSGGNKEKHIYSNWDDIGYLEIDDEIAKTAYHKYSFVINLEYVKVYFDGDLIGTHTFDFEGDTPTAMYNLENHIFGGYNQALPSLARSPLTGQYWSGNIANINVYNATLSQEQIAAIGIEEEYEGDQKIFADKIKLSSDFAVDGSKQLVLNTQASSFNSINQNIQSINTEIQTINTEIQTINTELDSIQNFNDNSKSYTIYIVDIEWESGTHQIFVNNYNDRNKQDYDGLLTFEPVFNHGDTITIDYGTIIDIMGYEGTTLYNLWLDFYVDGILEDTIHSGDGPPSEQYVLDAKKSYKFETGTFDANDQKVLSHTKSFIVQETFKQQFEDVVRTSDITDFVESTSLHQVATSGSYNDLINKPSLFSGSYDDLTSKPSLFSGSYNDLTSKPSLFSGSYNDLTSKPSLFSGSYDDLTSKPSLFSGSYDDLTSKPSLFSGSYDDLTLKPNLSIYATTEYVNANYYTKDEIGDLGYIQNTNASVIVEGDSTNGSGSIKLNCEVNTHYLELKAPDHSSFSGNITYTLPILPDTTGQVLSTDTSGNLSWITPQATGSTYFTETTDAVSGDNTITYDGDISCRNLYFRGTSSSYGLKSISALYEDIYSVMSILNATTVFQSGTRYLNYEKIKQPTDTGYLKYDGVNWVIDANVGGGSGITYTAGNIQLTKQSTDTEEPGIIFSNDGKIKAFVDPQTTNKIINYIGDYHTFMKPTTDENDGSKWLFSIGENGLNIFNGGNIRFWDSYFGTGGSFVDFHPSTFSGGSGGIAPFIPVNQPSPYTLSYRRTGTEEEIYETNQYIVFDEEVEFNNALRLERVNATVWQNLSIYNSTDKTQANIKDQADIFLCNDIYQLVFDRIVLPANLETYGTLFRINDQYKLHILNSLIKSYVDFEVPKIKFSDGTSMTSFNEIETEISAQVLVLGESLNQAFNTNLAGQILVLQNQITENANIIDGLPTPINLKSRDQTKQTVFTNTQVINQVGAGGTWHFYELDSDYTNPIYLNYFRNYPGNNDVDLPENVIHYQTDYNDTGFWFGSYDSTNTEWKQWLHINDFNLSTDRNIKLYKRPSDTEDPAIIFADGTSMNTAPTGSGSSYTDTDARTACFPLTQANTGLNIGTGFMNIFENDKWFNSLDGRNRLKFDADSHTYIRAPPTTDTRIVLQIGTVDKFRITDTINTSFNDLYVGDGVSPPTLFLNGPNANTLSSKIVFGDSGNGSGGTYMQGMTIIYNSFENRLEISGDNDVDSVVDTPPALSILRANRYVGILQSTPSYPLDVSGDIRAIGKVYCSSINFSDGTTMNTVPSGGSGSSPTAILQTHMTYQSNFWGGLSKKSVFPSSITTPINIGGFTFDHTNHRIIIPITGYYRISYNFNFTNKMNGRSTVEVQLYKNGSGLNIANRGSYMRFWGKESSSNADCIRQLNANDYIEVYTRAFGDGGSGYIEFNGGGSSIDINLIHT